MQSTASSSEGDCGSATFHSCPQHQGQQGHLTHANILKTLYGGMKCDVFLNQNRYLNGICEFWRSFYHQNIYTNFLSSRRHYTSFSALQVLWALIGYVPYIGKQSDSGNLLDSLCQSDGEGPCILNI